MSELGIALRSELFKEGEILESVRLVEQSKDVSHIFFPDIPGGQDAIELSLAALALARNKKIGTGVIRILEHDSSVLAKRLQTIQAISKNRFILGIGTGSPGAKPTETVDRLFSKLEQVKSKFRERMIEGVNMPEIFVAALRTGMAKRASTNADGILLNFCTPEHARTVSEVIRGRKPKIACYVKLFYSKEKNKANKLLLEEFVKYNQMPQYHAMFSELRIQEQISSSKEENVGRDLLKISLANPAAEELDQLINNFRSSGVEIPCLYPYFERNESWQFKKSVIENVCLT
ncbi:MAG: LLM class flavin-dependent oxidoreductase [Nitrososphaerales archaeon]